MKSCENFAVSHCRLNLWRKAHPKETDVCLFWFSGREYEFTFEVTYMYIHVQYYRRAPTEPSIKWVLKNATSGSSPMRGQTANASNYCHSRLPSPLMFWERHKTPNGKQHMARYPSLLPKWSICKQSVGTLSKHSLFIFSIIHVSQTLVTLSNKLKLIITIDRVLFSYLENEASLWYIYSISSYNIEKVT